MAYEPGDLAIKIDGYKLNIRAAGVIIHNGKIVKKPQAIWKVFPRLCKRKVPNPAVCAPFSV